jgi:hypothetical protein
MYSFDHGNLDATVHEVDDASPEWRLERVSYAAAYGDERIPAYLFLPKNASPPYQTVVFFPGSGVISRRTAPTAASFDTVNFIMRSGRAFLYPIYKSTHERGDVITTDYPNETAVWRDHMVMWSKDVGLQLGRGDGAAVPRGRAPAVAGVVERRGLLPAGRAAGG